MTGLRELQLSGQNREFALQSKNLALGIGFLSPDFVQGVHHLGVTIRFDGFSLDLLSLSKFALLCYQLFAEPLCLHIGGSLSRDYGSLLSRAHLLFEHGNLVGEFGARS
jgi:hypothetical protein